MKIKYLEILTLKLIILSGCAAGGGFDGPYTPFDENLIFINAAPIEIITPSQGDTLESITPVFSWEAPSSEMVYIGIFTKNISVSGGQINNIEDNIWGWHSGLGKGRIGFVNFSDGLNVVNGLLQIDNPPTPLQPNTTYSFAIWAWNIDGTSIGYASPEIIFVTGN